MKPINLLLVLALTLVFAGTPLAGAQQFNFTTLAGPAGGPLDLDGTGSAARFFVPKGVAVDNAGNVYVADTLNATIRKITPAGVVSTLAGLAGNTGSDDGTGSAARFANPVGVAVDNVGNVYVADTYNATIRKITPTGVVSTLVDGTGSAARFGGCNGLGCEGPTALAVDSAGNVYVADWSGTIRKITQGGVVSTLAGLAGTRGSADGAGNAARFSIPNGLAVDRAGNLYVADTENDTIRKITPEGVVSTLAGLAGNRGSLDGTTSSARFSAPWGVAVDDAGNVYVGENGNLTIRKITPSGVVSTLAGRAQSFGSEDGTGSAARFKYLMGIALDRAGTVYAADSGNHTIRKITPEGVVSTLAGLADNWEIEGLPISGSADGPGADARFDHPSAITVDSSGNAYVVDGNGIRKVTPAGIVTTLPGLWGTRVAVDSAGNLYLVSNDAIQKATPAGSDWAVTTLAGLAGSRGSTDGPGSAARFDGASGLAVDSAGNIYVGDAGNRTIRKITPDGMVSTLARLASTNKADYASGVSVDSVGNVYVADSGNGTVGKITPGGVVSTLAGLADNFGSEDGAGSAARFGGCNGLGCWGPSALAVDSAGNVYVLDSGSAIRKITPAGVVSTLAGLSLACKCFWVGDEDGTGSAARFRELGGVAVDSFGNVYVADTGNNKIRLGKPVFVTQPAFIRNSSFQRPEKTFQVEVTASTNQLVLIQATSVLPATNWITIQTVTLWNGRTTFIDASGSNFLPHFYRAISPVP